jgi:hypothetical protein
MSEPNISPTINDSADKPNADPAGRIEGIYQKHWQKYKDDIRKDLSDVVGEKASAVLLPESNNRRDTKPINYYPIFWGSYKGHVRGMLRGVLLGAAVGAAIGVGVAAFTFLGPLGLGAVAAAHHITFGAIVAGMTALSSIFLAETMGKLGDKAGAAASIAAQKELDLRYPDPSPLSINSPTPGVGHHYEVPADRDAGKIMHWRVAVPGGLLGAGIGALLAASGFASHIVPLAAEAIVGGTVAAAAPAAAVTFGLPIALGTMFGISFGVNRGIFKSIFNATDGIFLGRTWREQRRELEQAWVNEVKQSEQQDPALPQDNITSLERQHEYHRLQNEYFKQAFNAGFTANFRGLFGGIAVGGLSGAILGLAAAAVATTIGVSLPLAVAVAVGFGAYIGYSVYSEAGTSSAPFTIANDLYKARAGELAKGRDISFEEARDIVDARHAPIGDLPPADKDTHWFKPRMAVMGLAAGALAGLILAPVAGIPLLTLVGAISHTAGAAELIGMISAPGAGALIAQGLGLSTATFGLIGASFGLGPRITQGIQKIGDDIYHGAFFPGEDNPEIRHADLPLTSKSSHLRQQAHGKTMDVKVAVENELPVPEQPVQQQETVSERTSRKVREIVERGEQTLSHTARDAQRKIAQLGHNALGS